MRKRGSIRMRPTILATFAVGYAALLRALGGRAAAALRALGCPAQPLPPFRPPSPLEPFECPDDAMRVAREDADRAPVVEAVRPLPVAAGYLQRIYAGSREAVVTAGAPAAANLRLGHGDRAVRCMIDHAGSRLHARAHRGTRDHHAVVVVDLDPLVVDDADLRRILVVDPARLHTA